MLTSKKEKLHKVVISSWSKLSGGGTVLVFRFLAAVCCEQLTVQQCVVCCLCHNNTALFSPFRIHFEELKQIPVLKLDASVEFKSDPEVQEQFITKVCLNTY